MNAIASDWNWRHQVANSDLQATTKHVLLTLSLFVSDLGESVFPSVTKLAKYTSLSTKAVRQHLQIGHNAGWIVKAERHVESGRQTSNEYRLSRPVGEGEPSSPFILI